MVILLNESDADMKYKLIVKAKVIKEQKKYSDNYGNAYYTTFELPSSAAENGKVNSFYIILFVFGLCVGTEGGRKCY